MKINLVLLTMVARSRAFKIITHLSEALLLEEEEFLDIDQKYLQEFTSDFSLELEFVKTIKRDQKQEEKENPITSDKKVLKKIHKKLARVTHPDVNDGEDEDFKKIQSAYESGDGPTLISAAIKHDVEVSLTDEEINKMMSDIHDRRRSIEKKKTALRWMWCQSNKHPDLRKQVLEFLQVNIEEFNRWSDQKK